MKKDTRIIKELEFIRKKNGGLLRGADVVDFATNPKTALHDKFQWDDSAAAREFRLWQARELIRVAVTVLKGTDKSTRCFVSLYDDRKTDGGGYRAMVDVMSDPEMRTALLQQANAEAQSYRQKYRMLLELAPLFEAMDKVFSR